MTGGSSGNRTSSGKKMDLAVGAEMVATDGATSIFRANDAAANLLHHARFPAISAMTDRTICSIRPRASGSRRGFAELRCNRELLLRPGAGRCELLLSGGWTVTIAGGELGTIFGASRDRIRAVAALLRRRRRLGARYGFKRWPRDRCSMTDRRANLTEMALEARVRVGDFGIVPFVDAGNISTSPLPVSATCRSAGIGVATITASGRSGRCGHALNPRSGIAHRRLRLARQAF